MLFYGFQYMKLRTLSSEYQEVMGLGELDNWTLLKTSKVAASL